MFSSTHIDRLSFPVETVRKDEGSYYYAMLNANKMFESDRWIHQGIYIL